MEHPHYQAQVIAHYCEHNTREGYRFEKAKAAGDKPSGSAPDQPPSWSMFRQGGGK
jgi:hypothetical protein